MMIFFIIFADYIKNDMEYYESDATLQVAKTPATTGGGERI
jgi:hypothetical protein